jgi:thiol-disulfide isomerase/thioredoxin
MKWFALLLAAGCGMSAMLRAQQPGQPPPVPPPVNSASPAASETETLQRSLGEAGNSPKDYIRVLEAHLAKYPNTAKRAEIEKTLAQAAAEAHDDDRIIKYGERQLQRDPADIVFLDRVPRAYLNKDDPDSARKALAWTDKFAQAVDKLRGTPPPGRMSAAQWLRDLDQAGGRALVLKARATGKLGDSAAAARLAKQSFDLYPTAESAREEGKWLAAMGDLQDAIDRYADAFTIEDPRNNEQDRSKDRRRLGELYVKATGSERGLGDRILASYDRMSAIMTARLAQLKSKDPNAEAGSILDFTLPSPNGNPLPLTSLKGKTIVFDFWATWCVPCRAQRPLYEDVEHKFSADKDVVFVSVNTDEDRAQVAPFLKQQNWKNTVYYDAGLADFVKVTSIPTTLIVDRSGQIASRMNGFIPERFVDLLTQRIEETRH